MSKLPRNFPQAQRISFFPPGREKGKIKGREKSPRAQPTNGYLPPTKSVGYRCGLEALTCWTLAGTEDGRVAASTTRGQNFNRECRWYDNYVVIVVIINIIAVASSLSPPV